MKSSRNLPFHTRRDAWVEINLGAIEHNTLEIRNSLPDPIKVMAVIKADAYGHGALMVLPTLEACGVSMIGVAAMDEAIQIRESGITMPILVLGVTPDWSMHYAIEHDIQITIFSPLHLASLERLYEITQIPTKVHIKVDTGMHRIGVLWKEAAAFIEKCQNLPFLDVQGVFSHFAFTEDKNFTLLQIQRWSKVLNELVYTTPLRHIANSSALWGYPLPEQTNMVRLGISIFGYSEDKLSPSVGLKPAMGLKARVVHLQDLPVGEGVSYNQTFINTTTMTRRIATLPLGYADGIPRSLSNKIEGFYREKLVKQVGNITMDQLMVDVTDVPDATVGDVITLVGSISAMGKSGKKQGIWLTDWAKKINTIEYELMCSLRVRLPKVYVR